MKIVGPPPDNILRLMRPEDRLALGKAGVTKDEAEAAFVARSEKELQNQIEAMKSLSGLSSIPPSHFVGWPITDRILVCFAGGSGLPSKHLTKASNATTRGQTP